MKNYSDEFINKILDINPTFLIGKINNLDKLEILFNSTHLSNYSINDASKLIRFDTLSFPSCLYCNKEIRKINRKYCNQKCYKADPKSATKISEVKTALYQNEVWKKATEKKKIDTCLLNNGVNHPMQDSTIFAKHEKNSFQSKMYRGLNGIRGFEPYVIDYLIDQFNFIPNYNLFTGTQIMTKNSWKFKGKKGNYNFPDLYLTNYHCFIEVKGEYTFAKDFEKIKELEYVINKECGAEYYVLLVTPKKSNVISLVNPKTGVIVNNILNTIWPSYRLAEERGDFCLIHKKLPPVITESKATFKEEIRKIIFSTESYYAHFFEKHNEILKKVAIFWKKNQHLDFVDLFINELAVSCDENVCIISQQENNND
jgi:hypothetical protein